MKLTLSVVLVVCLVLVAAYPDNNERENPVENANSANAIDAAAPLKAALDAAGVEDAAREARAASPGHHYGGHRGGGGGWNGGRRGGGHHGHRW